ncbi:hypothetical protein GCM10027578_32560 [Spirosoma luteolum]
MHANNAVISSELQVSGQTITYTIRVTGILCSAQAWRLREMFQGMQHSATILLDLSQVSKMDIQAVQALATGHKLHRLTVVQPLSAEGGKMLHLTKFTQVLNLVPSPTATYVDSFSAKIP